MILVEIHNNYSTITDKSSYNGRLPSHLQESIYDTLSYLVPNAEWSPKFKQGLWDGKISIYNKRNQTFPTGLCGRIKSLFDTLKLEYSFVDKRLKPEQNYPIESDFGGKELRFYQKDAADLALKCQRGMLSLATGAGKTLTSCQIFSNLQVAPVLFIVPAIELLKQTQKEFEKILRMNGETVQVGIAGDGICQLNFNGINVMTYQTALAAYNKKYSESQYKIVEDKNQGDGSSKTTEQLQKEFNEASKLYKSTEALCIRLNHTEVEKSKKLKVPLANLKKKEAALNTRLKAMSNKKNIRDLISSVKALIVDEAHVAPVVIEEISNSAEQAYYKLGLSATPFRTDNQEIRIEGTLGRKIIEVNASDLIELGFLVPPKIFMCPIETIEPGETYQEVYSNNIVNNWERNYRIKQFAESFKESGRPTLILVERLEHGNILEGMIEDSVFVPGGDKGELDPSDEEKNYRRRMLNAVENNEVILIATQWANVGVDAPKISSLILAGSSSSPVTTYQQAGRVLRCVGKDLESSINNGKPDAIVIDFSTNQKHLRQHSLMRKKVYRNERAWRFEELK
jgi:superfamily II DNA or RNA helicase